MGNEINAVIDNLCEKFGATASELIPEIVRAGISKSVIAIAIGLFVVVCMILLFRGCVKEQGDESWLDEGTYLGVALFAIIMAFFGIIFTSGYISNLIEWIISPKAKAIEQILRMVK